MKSALAAATAISAILCSFEASAGQNINLATPRIAPISTQRMELPQMRTTDRQLNPDKQSALLKKRHASPKHGVRGKLVNSNILRANEVRGLRDVAAVTKPVMEAFDDLPGRNGGAAADAQDAARQLAELRQRFGLGSGGLDWLGLINGPLGGHANQHPRSTFPGLVPDLNRLPGVSAQGDGEKETERTPDADGNIRTSTVGTDRQGNTVSVVKEVDAAGQVSVTKAVSQADGGYWSQRANPDGSTHTYIETTGGATRTIHTYSTGFQMIWDTGRNGEQRTHMRGDGGGIARSLTGEEGGASGWCPPSGWGCKGPMTAADIIAGGRRERPNPDAQSTAAGPSLGIDPGSLVVNPNPDVYASGGGAGGVPFNPCQDCDGDGRGGVQ